MNGIVFLQGDKIVRSKGAQDLAVCSRMRASVTGQHDWRETYLVGQVAILARHCPLTGCYFEPWAQLFEGRLAFNPGQG